MRVEAIWVIFSANWKFSVTVHARQVREERFDSVSPNAIISAYSYLFIPNWERGTTMNTELRWAQPNIEKPILGYNIWRHNNEYWTEIESHTKSDNTNYTDTNIMEPNKNYWYAVRAIHPDSLGEWSEVVLATPACSTVALATPTESSRPLRFTAEKVFV